MIKVHEISFLSLTATTTEHPCVTIDGMDDDQIISPEQITLGDNNQALEEGVTLADSANPGTPNSNCTQDLMVINFQMRLQSFLLFCDFR